MTLTIWGIALIFALGAFTFYAGVKTGIRFKTVVIKNEGVTSSLLAFIGMMAAVDDAKKDKPEKPQPPEHLKN